MGATVATAPDGDLVLFADIEEALRSASRYAWLEPVLFGSENDALVRARTQHIELAVRKHNLRNQAAVDWAMRECPL